MPSSWYHPSLWESVLPKSWKSRSLGAAEQGRSVIVVTYESHYDLSEVPYNAGSVVQAFVSLTPGPPSPASRFGEGDLGSLICG
jgi:hypothetical protein